MNSRLLPTLVLLQLCALIPGCARTGCSEIETSASTPGSVEKDPSPYVDTKLTMTEDRDGGRVVKTAERGQMLRIKGEYRVARADRTPPGVVAIYVMLLRPGKKPLVMNSKMTRVNEKEGRHYFEQSIKVPETLHPRHKYEVQIMGARIGEESQVIMKQPFVVK